ncbi:hypothetical protein [Flavobacterium sp. SM2513]|uniref:hypothetical protein n=1 Tax=Flavobacterium sp. SM2513 TaxID=3424766 RepID=UPI003D7F6037
MNKLYNFLILLALIVSTISCTTDELSENNAQVSNETLLQRDPATTFLTDHDGSGSGGSGGGSDCVNVSTFSGSCTTGGYFTGKLLLENCLRITVAASYNSTHVLSNLTVTLPSVTGAALGLSTSYSLLSTTYIYNVSNQTYYINLGIKKTETNNNSGNPIVVETFIYKTIRVVPCNQQMVM